MWLFWDVTIKCRDELVGGWPKAKSAEDALLRARGLPDLIQPDPDLSNLTVEGKQELAEQAVKKSWTGFHSDENGELYVETRCVKAMIKEAGNILKGMIGIGFFLALGQSPAYFTLQGTRGPWVQLGNAVAGLLLAYVSGAPLVGNALLAAGLWKASFISYAGLTAFYLGTLVMPFALPRYVDLFGLDVSKRLLGWMVGAILMSALVATAWWWGLDWFAGVVGLRDLFEALSHSTLRPNDVPWFHHWFQSMPGR